jgi:hypothetical protein
MRNGSVKRLVVSAAVVGACVVSALFFFRSPGGPKGFATPGECLDVYREASRAGDVSRCLDCLDDALRAEKKCRLTAEKLRNDNVGVKSWTQVDPVVQNAVAHIDVDEIRPGDARRVRYHFKKTRGGWRIAKIDPPAALPGLIPYGTPVDKAP